MFSVIISEKGGAERRESFDRTEINVGRVQGNDLMLPKGNVSKRHARLIYRDGRFIVTDLKSTNGTYVNGRKITQATIVREGDKIYIGDFVLRVETSPSASSGAASASGSTGESNDESIPLADVPPSEPPQLAPLGGATSAQMPVASLLGTDSPSRPGIAPLTGTPAAPSTAMPPTSITEMPAAPPERTLSRPPPTRIEAKPHEPSRQEFVSHFPLEQDPDESIPFNVPAPPRVPSAPRVPGKPSVPPPPRAGATPLESKAPPRPGSSPFLPPSPPVDRSPMQQAPLGPAMGTPPAVTPRRAMPPAPPEPAERLAVHRSALAALVERASESIDRAELDNGAPPSAEIAAQVERALAARMQAGAPAEIAADTLLVEARRELLEYGPLTPLLGDDEISEIQVLRHDHVVVVQGRRPNPLEIGFSSERSATRALARLCAAAGQPLGAGEVFVERRLARGARLFAVLPPAAPRGPTFVIRRPQRAEQSLEDLVRSGTISRAMAGLFSQCVAARANILVTGTDITGTAALMGALAMAGSPDERVVVLQDDDELIVAQPQASSIVLTGSPHDRGRAVRATARLRPDRMLAFASAGPVAAALIDAASEGLEGIIAAARAPSARQAIARLTADLAAERPGVAPEATREWLASAFSLVIEIARLRDGRHRVLRVAELVLENGRLTLRDIFAFVVERTAAGGAVEGSFHPTGAVPLIVDDWSARGISIDPSIFKRHMPSRPDLGPPPR